MTPNGSALESRCGTCIPCRIYRRRVWECRALLEARFSRTWSCLTLTIAPEYLPGDQAQYRKDLVDWCKRTRERFGPFRFMAVGELGELRGRPHYHVIEFGRRLSAAEAAAAWPNGFVKVDAQRNAQRAVRYCVKYIMKSKRERSEEERDGLQEFFVMSRRPGIGAPALDSLEEALNTAAGKAYIERYGDVFATVRIDGRVYPLGRYLRNKLRERLGLPTVDVERIERLVSESDLWLSPSIAFADRQRKRERASQRVERLGYQA